MIPDNDLPTSIRLPPDIKRKLESIARIRRQPTSLLIVRILELWLEAQEKNK